MSDYIELERTDDLREAKILYGPYPIVVKNGKAKVPAEIVDELVSGSGHFKPATKKAENQMESRLAPDEKEVGAVASVAVADREEPQSSSDTKKSK